MISRVFILVHGAWHGSWAWRKIAPLLKAQGHTVLTPDLPGHGKAFQGPFKNIHLATYVDFLVSLIGLQTQPVYLVGHSLGGAIISQVAEYIPHKIAELIYVAALLPTDKRSAVQEASQQSFIYASQLMTANKKTNEMVLSLLEPAKVRQAFYESCTDNDFEDVMQLLQVEPWLPMVTPLCLTERFAQVKKCYIACWQDKAVHIDNQLRMAQNANITDWMLLNCDHSPFLSVPQALAQLLSTRL